MEFVRDVILFLATQGWQKLADEQSDSSTSGCDEAIVRLYTKFTLPLEAVDVTVGDIVDEFTEMSLLTCCHMPHSSYLSQALIIKTSGGNSFILRIALIGQTFWHLPDSYSHFQYRMENLRVFSTMKNIKLEKRSTMSNEMLDDLLTINIDKINIEDFRPDHSIDLWWKAKTRRPNQQPRKKYKKRSLTNDSTDADIDNILVIQTLIQIIY